MRNLPQEHHLPPHDGSYGRELPFCQGEGVCLTCSDEALSARVLSLGEEAGLALVEISGTITEIDVTLVEAVAPGDWLLTHGGVALGRMGESESHEICG